MKMRVQVVIESAGGEPTDVHEIACLEREELRLDTLGLTLNEAKTVLERIQQQLVEQQTAEYLCTQRHCSDCGNKRYHKGEHRVTIRTLFGKLRLKSPRQRARARLLSRHSRGDGRPHRRPPPNTYPTLPDPPR
jgi:hypothetical protein